MNWKVVGFTLVTYISIMILAEILTGIAQMLAPLVGVYWALGIIVAGIGLTGALLMGFLEETW